MPLRHLTPAHSRVSVSTSLSSAPSVQRRRLDRPLTFAVHVLTLLSLALLLVSNRYIPPLTLSGQTVSGKPSLAVLLDDVVAKYNVSSILDHPCGEQAEIVTEFLFNTKRQLGYTCVDRDSGVLAARYDTLRHLDHVDAKYMRNVRVENVDLLVGWEMELMEGVHLAKEANADVAVLKADGDVPYVDALLAARVVSDGVVVVYEVQRIS